MKEITQDIKQTEIQFQREDFKTTVSVGKTREPGLSKELHPEIEIKYFCEGSSVLVIDDETIPVQKGNIVVVNPYEIHFTPDISEKPARYHLFMISLDFFSDGITGAFDLRHILVGKQLRFKHLIEEDVHLQSLLSRVVTEMENQKEHYEYVVRGLLLEFFALLLRDYVEPETRNMDRGEATKYYAIIEPALHKIRSDYMKKLSVAELAEICNISKFYFCRVFKLVTGVTAVQYIADYRFKIANLLLTNAKSSIAEVARSCGFEDEAYFCRCYKKKYGITPNKNKARLFKK